MSEANTMLVSIDTEKEIQKILKSLDTMHNKAPNILRNSINAAARKARKRIVADAQERYAVNKKVFKNENQGAPKLSAARMSNLTATITSKGPMQDIMQFITRPNSMTGAAAAQVLNSGSMRPLERDGLKAFVTTFANGHVAIVQRKPPASYGASGRAVRAAKHGAQSDMTKIKKLLSPAVPHMLANEEVRGQAEELVVEILHQEIQKRMNDINNPSNW